MLSKGYTSAPSLDSVVVPSTGGKGEVIVQHDGVVLWCSRFVHDRLDAGGVLVPEGARCCEVLDCSGNTAEGEERCLTRLALANPEPLPERPWRSGLAAGTISAESLQTSGAAIVIFELEFPDDLGARADARQRGWDTAFEVRALGPMSVRAGDVTLDGEWLYQRTGQLFRYLIATRDRPVRAQMIASELWPDRERAVTNVRYGICKLREQLDTGPTSESVILTSTGGYRLDSQRLRLDVDVFETRVAAGLETYRAGSHSAAEELLSFATSLYAGDFLADDPYAEWALTEREYLRALACEALTTNAQIAQESGRLTTATDRLARLVELEPFDSEGHQLLLEVCLRRGRRTEALRRYAALSFRLEQTFGEKPDFDLPHIAARVREPERRARSAVR
jgi:DNA-binding SARP family transcriptional activator